MLGMRGRIYVVNDTGRADQACSSRLELAVGQLEAILSDLGLILGDSKAILGDLEASWEASWGLLAQRGPEAWLSLDCGSIF